MIGASDIGHAGYERRMRRRRIAKVLLAILFAVIWIPAAIVMLVAGTSDRRR